MRNDVRARNHPAWWAFLVHRLSGLALALFLPMHFLVLGAALAGEAALDDALAWTQTPLVKLMEWVLVVLLAAHLAGGLRLLALELLQWREWQKTLLAAAAGLTIVVGLALALAL
jgi:fumarate reductase subunit D